MHTLRSSANKFVLRVNKFALKRFIISLSLTVLFNVFQARIVLGRQLFLCLNARHFMCFILFMFLVASVNHEHILMSSFVLFHKINIKKIVYFLCISLLFLLRYTNLNKSQHISFVINPRGVT